VGEQGGPRLLGAGVVAGGGALGVGGQLVGVALPQLLELVGLGAVVGHPDQLLEGAGVGRQRGLDHLPQLRDLGDLAAGQPHRQQGVLPEQLLEPGPDLAGRGVGGQGRWRGRVVGGGGGRGRVRGAGPAVPARGAADRSRQRHRDQSQKTHTNPHDRPSQEPLVQAAGQYAKLGELRHRMFGRALT
jgi:hypothetical protein